MEKRILVPVDFSDDSLNALEYAMELFKDEECNFFLLNAYHSVYFTADKLTTPEEGEVAYEQAKRDSEAGLADLLETLSFSSPYHNHNFEPISTQNTVNGAVEECLQRRNIDLLVMGTKGRHKPTSNILGSNALEMMEKVTDCPILVIPEGAAVEQGNKKEIVFATNYRVDYKRRELIYLQGIANRCGAAIRILNIGDKELDPEQKIYKFKLEQFFADFEHTFHTLTNVEVAKGIHSFIQSRNSDMLALIHTKPGFFKNFFSPSVIKEIGDNPLVPLLILHD